MERGKMGDNGEASSFFWRGDGLFLYFCGFEPGCFYLFILGLCVVSFCGWFYWTQPCKGIFRLVDPSISESPIIHN